MAEPPRRPPTLRVARRCWLRAAGVAGGSVLAARAIGQTGAAPAAAASPAAAAAMSVRRVVGLGGPMTEIVYALGAGALMVGADDSSIFPEAATRLPKVGYYRSFSVEGVAALRPDLVIASSHAGPPASLEQLRGLGLRVAVFDAAPTRPALATRIAGIADVLGRAAAGATLQARIDREIAAAPPLAGSPRVLVLSSHTGRLLSAGRDTAADAMLALVGARNLAGTQSGYKPIAGESVAALRPDVIVTTTLSASASGGAVAFARQPGIATTPAARAGRIVVIDDLLLLGFGPRIGEALQRLAAGLAAPAATGAR